MSEARRGGQPPNCYRCLHFFITYEPALPYGCRFMGFKSARLPAEAVFASSGMHCQSFTKKPKPKG
ncbi:MAG: uracil-DNA glycosylase [Thermodesulfobacteriota bacterium]